jgi:acylaminoacyl-peptidase
MTVPETRVNPRYKSLDYEYILLEPQRKDQSPLPPLAVYIHGGPHGAFIASFELYMASLCLCGYSILLVNYRGSTGFGQDSIESLLGKIGRQDMDDVQSVAEQVASSGAVDKEKVVVIGGSHGGFLTAHAISQFPEFYRAAVARNPVINIASMVGVTDIPDWSFTEVGLQFDVKKLPSAEIYGEMLKKSPIVNVDRIKTPLLLLVGGKDLRVPPFQSLEMKKALDSRGLPVKMLWYPDCSHPITDVKSEADAFVNIVKWFNDHLNM